MIHDLRALLGWGYFRFYFHRLFISSSECFLALLLFYIWFENSNYWSLLFHRGAGCSKFKEWPWDHRTVLLAEASFPIKFQNLLFPLLGFSADDLKTCWSCFRQEVLLFDLRLQSPENHVSLSCPQTRLGLAARKVSLICAAQATSKQ